MKKLLSVILILCLVFASAVPVFAADASGTTVELVKTTGKVTITTAGGQKVDFKSDKATKLVDGYTVKTGAASYAYISLDQTQAIKMDASTTVTIDKKGKKLDVNLVSGKLIYDVKEPLKKDQSTTVSTSNSITGIRGTFGLVRTFFDLNLGRQVSATTLFEGHSKVSTLGESGNIVSSIMVSAGNILESIGNMAKSSQLTKDDFAGFMAVELAENPALLARVEKALAESDNPEAANINVREIAANAETILAADEKQAEEEAKALEAELAAQKVEQEKAEAAAKTDKLDGQEDVVQLFDGETAATDPAADAVSAESAENATGDTGSSGGSSSGSTTTSEYNPTDATSLADAFTQANLDAASGKASVINAPTSGDFSNQSYDVGQNVTINSNNNFNPGTLNLNGGKLTGNMNSSGSTINVNGTGSEISGNITAGTLNVNGGGGLNVATGSTFNATSVNVASGGSMTNAGNFTATDLTVNGNMTNTKNVTASNSMTVDGGTYTTNATGATTTINKNLTVNNNGTYTGNPTISGSGNTLELGAGAGAAQDNATINGNVILANNATLNMNSGSVTNGVTVNGCTVNANGGTITGGIVGNSDDARVIISGTTVNGGITGRYSDDYTDCGVVVNSGTVNGGINISSGTVEVTGGTVTGGTYGIKTGSTVKVSGGNINGTSYGIHHDVSGKVIEISGGDISGPTGLYFTSEGASVTSATVTGGTVTGTNGDGIIAEGSASLKIGADPQGYGNNISGTAVISSTGGTNTGAINHTGTTSVSLISGTIKNTASSGYALKGYRYHIGTGMNENEIVSGQHVKLSAPTEARMAENPFFTSQLVEGTTYALTGLGSKTVTTAAELTDALAAGKTVYEQCEGGTVVNIGSNLPSNIQVTEATIYSGTTLNSNEYFQPQTLYLAGGTLEGRLELPGHSIIATGSDTSAIEASVSAAEVKVNENATLNIKYGSSFTSDNYIALNVYGLLRNDATINTDKVVLTAYSGSTINNNDTITLSNASNPSSLNGARLNGDITVEGGTLEVKGSSYVSGHITAAGTGTLKVEGGTIESDDTTAAVTVSAGDDAKFTMSGGSILSRDAEAVLLRGGSEIKIMGGAITGTNGIVADSNTTGHNLVITGGTITGTTGCGIRLGSSFILGVGTDENMDGTTIVGSATISGTTNGIEIDNATGHGKCYLISGKVQSTATDGDYYAINGTYGGVYNTNSMPSEAFYLGDYDGFTHGDHIDAVKAKKVQVKARDIDHLGSWSNSSSNFTLDTDTNWWYLSN